MYPVSIWGFAERLGDFSGRKGHYGELAASSQYGGWFTTFAGGFGNAFLWRPQWMQHVTAGRLLESWRLSLGLGVTRVHYGSQPAARHQFHSGTLTMQAWQNLSLSLVGQLIRQSIESPDSGEASSYESESIRDGRGVGISANWLAGRDSVSLSALFTCMGRWPCAADANDRYHEFFWDLRKEAGNGLGAIGRVGMTSSPRAAQVWFGGYQRW
jgi:hypothetical protein